MKTSKATILLATCASALAVTTTFHASADESSTAAPIQNEQPSPTATGDDKSCTGIIISVDAKEHVMSVKNWAMYTRKFNLGDGCSYAQMENNHAPATDLRPGEKVTVNYQDSQGEMIAGRVLQEPMRFEGLVIALDNEKHTVTLHQPGLDKVLTFPAESKIVLRDGKYGNFNDVKVGNYVVATYEMPANDPTVRQIAEASIPFIGTLTAVDLNKKTLKARTIFTAKTFQLADNCTIVVNGRPDGQLGDLKLNDKLLFSYDHVNGVNVVTRIAPADARVPSLAASSQPATPTYGYNAGF